MTQVHVYERATPSFAEGLSKRGHHVVYRANASNHCPGCGRSQWYIGRVSAECGFCGTAVALAETCSHHSVHWSNRRHPEYGPSPDQRQFPRVETKGRKLKLLVDGSPEIFAVRNLSEGGLMGDNVADLPRGTKVRVRFEGGILVPAVVKWTQNDLLGLAFLNPIILDGADNPSH